VIEIVKVNKLEEENFEELSLLIWSDCWIISLTYRCLAVVYSCLDQELLRTLWIKKDEYEFKIITLKMGDW
jgi:hypothetical protein